MTFSKPIFALTMSALAVITAPFALAGASGGHWIWATGDKTPQQTIYARKDFDLKKVEPSHLWVAADNSAEVWLNGTKLTRSQDHATPTLVEITKHLKEGTNTISLQAKNEDGPAGVFLLVKSGETLVATDKTWLASSTAIKGWHDPNFTNKAFTPAVEVTAIGTAPYDKFNEKALLASLSDLDPVDDTNSEKLKVLPGFAVDRLYTVPRKEQGSWVTLCEDDQGRFIAGDQSGALYRFPAPAPGQRLASSDVEKIDLDIGHAWGLCYAFDALYVVVNENKHGGRGLYRVKDTNGDDQFDQVTLLKKFQEEGGEHGPHAVIPSPDGKSLYIACGNQTALPDGAKPLMPATWGEDQLLPRVYGKGFMKGKLAPLGWVARTDPDGKEWEIIATGFRNQYDIDFNLDGELFTYDADMEWDINTPWYRPTRINHVLSGGEYGWRNGSAKWPDYYPDSFGAVVNIGPGSPTGVTFGTGAKFPAKYQSAFFACDWSYGKMFAVHMQPHGSTYSAEFEEFVSGQPLALTDLVIAKDGAMYFTVGGRGTQSALYRITYTGGEDTSDISLQAKEDAGAKARAVRHDIESFHARQSPDAVTVALPQLGSSDRALRFAARIALEHQEPSSWIPQILAATDPDTITAGAVAIARSQGVVINEDLEGNRAEVPISEHQAAVLDKLNSLDYATLSQQTGLDLLRAYSLAFIRLGAPNDAQKAAVLAKLEPHFPTKSRAENIELSQLLVYLGSEQVVAKSIDIIESAPTQEEQIALAKDLRRATKGWTPELEDRLFRWFSRAKTYKGGASFTAFTEEIERETLARFDPNSERGKALAKLAEKPANAQQPAFSFKQRNFVKAWTMEDLKPSLGVGLEGGRNFENGREVFGASTCYACHRFNEEGGSLGPDLTTARGKFSPHDLLEAVINPSKDISDQYSQMVFTMKDGSTQLGRIANLHGDDYRVITDMFDPGKMALIDRRRVESIEPSKVSMMPPGLLYNFTEDDILDLLAYILSGGDTEDPLFK